MLLVKVATFGGAVGIIFPSMELQLKEELQLLTFLNPVL